MNYYRNSEIVFILLGENLMTSAEKFMDSRTPEGVTSEVEISDFLWTRMAGTDVFKQDLFEAYARIKKLDPVKVPLDLYDLPQDVVVKFWKNFEAHVKGLSSTKSKHNLVNAVLDEPSAAERIMRAFDWSETPEGLDYWNQIHENIK